MVERLLILRAPTTPDSLEARQRIADADLVILDRGNGSGRVVKDRYTLDQRELAITFWGEPPERVREIGELASDICAEARRMRLVRAGVGPGQSEPISFEQMQESEQRPWLDAAEAVLNLRARQP